MHPSSDAHAEPEEEINSLWDNSNNKNIYKTINANEVKVKVIVLMLGAMTKV